jgi:hypothetical protein
VAQQELAQALACPLLILSGILTVSDQVTQSFVRGVRDPHRGEVAGAVAPRQFGGIPAIRLHPLSSFNRHQRGSHGLAGNASSEVTCQ